MNSKLIAFKFTQMDGLMMTWDVTFFSTVFLSYQDNEMVILKGFK